MYKELVYVLEAIVLRKGKGTDHNLVKKETKN